MLSASVVHLSFSLIPTYTRDDYERVLFMLELLMLRIGIIAADSANVHDVSVTFLIFCVVHSVVRG